MKVLILQFRWWLWSLLAERVPKWSWPQVDLICPKNEDLDLLDAIDRSGT